MRLYKVTTGKSRIENNKWNSLILQYGLFFIGFSLSIFLSSFLTGFISIAFFIAVSCYVSNAIESDSARVYFFPTCSYSGGEINRLYGFSEGYTKWNSASIGWRSINNKNIEIVADCYVDGIRIVKHMITAKTQAWIFINIQNKNSKYVLKGLTPKGESITVSVDKNKKISLYSLFKLFIYKLNPNFKNLNTGDKEIKFYMTKLLMK